MLRIIPVTFSWTLQERRTKHSVSWLDRLFYNLTARGHRYGDLPKPRRQLLKVGVVPQADERPRRLQECVCGAVVLYQPQAPISVWRSDEDHFSPTHSFSRLSPFCFSDFLWWGIHSKGLMNVGKCLLNESANQGFTDILISWNDAMGHLFIENTRTIPHFIGKKTNVPKFSLYHKCSRSTRVVCEL